MENHPQSAVDIDTLILGAGPAGLAAAYALSKQGIIPVLVEKSQSAGGLMRSLRRGDFIVDVGRKELYTRLDKVNTLWRGILGEDYVTYQHREGILYDGKILETDSRWLGRRRGIPWSMVITSGLDYIWWRMKGTFNTPKTYEEYWYGKRGKRLSTILSQGFEEKFKGINWRDLPPPPEKSADAGNTVEMLSDPLLAQHLEERDRPLWRHPAEGSGQICEILEKNIREAGATIRFGADIVSASISGSRIDTITIAVKSEVTAYRPRHVISSVPAEIMARLLSGERPDAVSPAAKPEKPPGHSMSVICVYLFLREPPRFPHIWLKVTSPNMKAGRITNYAALNGRMVPKGMTCLCIEYFWARTDSLLTLEDEELGEYAMGECARAGLIDRDKCFDHLVLKLPGANAATSWRDWINPRNLQLLSFLTSFDNLYYVNRPGTDKATYAGLEAAAAIVANDRRVFFAELALSIPVGIREVPHDAFNTR